MFSPHKLRMPVSRIRCKPGAEGGGGTSSSAHLLAATYVSGFLRIFNYDNGLCVGQVYVWNIALGFKYLF